MASNRFGIQTVNASGIGANVSHNNAINEIDALLHLAPSEFGQNTPPAHSAGLVVVVGSAGTGAYSGHSNEIAASLGGAWTFFSPEEGTVLWVKGGSTAVDTLRVYDGTDWQLVLTGANETQEVARIESPVLNDRVPLLYTMRDLTLQSVLSIVEGSSTPTCTWNVMFAASRSAAGTQVFAVDQVTSSTTSGDVDSTGFADNTIPAGNFVWFEIEASPGGTLDACEWYIRFTEDPA